MSLRLSLKPGERVVIGGAVVRNGDSRIELYLENEVPLLREADILAPRAATTPCRRIYLALQLMYVDPAHLDEHQQRYRSLIDDMLTAVPSSRRLIERIDAFVSAGRYYQAIKSAQALLDYEGELLSDAGRRTAGVRRRRPDDDKRARAGDARAVQGGA